MKKNFRRKILPYNPWLKLYARKLRNNATKSEILLWRRLKGKQMMGYTFHRQKPLLNFIADFYCYDLKLVIELDGYYHEREEVKIKDEVKQKSLEKLGLTVLRFQNDEVFEDLGSILDKIEVYILKYEENSRQ